MRLSVCGLPRRRCESAMPCVRRRKTRALAGKGLVLSPRSRPRRAPRRIVPIHHSERVLRLRLLLRELPLARVEALPQRWGGRCCVVASSALSAGPLGRTTGQPTVNLLNSSCALRRDGQVSFSVADPPFPPAMPRDHPSLIIRPRTPSGCRWQLTIQGNYASRPSRTLRRRRH